MPLEPTSFCASLSGVVLGKLPTAAIATRTNPVLGVVPHNPYIEMVNACALGWLTTIMTPGIIIDAYAGVVGAVGTAVPTPLLFPRAATVTDVSRINSDEPAPRSCNRGWGSKPIIFIWIRAPVYYQSNDTVYGQRIF